MENNSNFGVFFLDHIFLLEIILFESNKIILDDNSLPLNI